MPIKILAIGKKHEDWVIEGIQRYQKRLRAPFTAEWVLLPHSSLEGERARLEESERLTERLSTDSYLVLLDERGVSFDSPTLAAKVDHLATQGKTITFLIGGAYGVTEALREKADLVWSLSPLVFPHQLVRLILTEQLYRAQQILTGGSYHHQ
jgi:23S rRNA (pseudouridine1915-N3)-methyltransferase